METRIPTIPTERGKRMAMARETAGLTQDDMAKELGVSHATINKWEHEAQPRDMMTVLAKWEKLTGVPVWWILNMDDPSINKRGSSTRSNRNGPGRNRQGGIAPGEAKGLEEAA